MKNIRIVLAFIFILLAPAAFAEEEKEESMASFVWHSAVNKFRNATKNGVLQCIKSRRSVRSYASGQIKESDLLAVIEAGLYAPSAKNGQPWHITVVQNAGLLEEMTAQYKEEIIKRGGEAAKIAEEDTAFKIFHGAPCAIIVSGDASDEMSYIGCAAAVENMLIAATSLGLGTCWMQSTMLLFEGSKGTELIKTIKIPDGYKPLYTFAMGYPAEEPEEKPRKAGAVTYVK